MEVTQHELILQVKNEERAVASEAFRLNVGESTSSASAVGNFSASRVAPGELEGAPVIVSLSGPSGEELSVSLPASELAKLGNDVVVVVGSIQPEVVFDSLVGSAGLATPLLSIKLSNDPNGESFVSVKELQEPILIKLSLRPLVANSLGRFPQCAWLNEDEDEWYGTGLTRMDFNESQLTCATTHLTIFAGIIGELADTLKCSNAAVMSSHGLQRMVHGAWILSPAALFLWCLVLFHVLLISVARCFDTKGQRKLFWSDEYFLVNDPHLSDPPGETVLETLKGVFSEAKAKAAEVHLIFKNIGNKEEQDGEPFPGSLELKEKVKKMSTAVMMGTLLKVIAVNDHVDADDLQGAIDRLKGQRQRSPQSVGNQVELSSEMQSIDADLEAGMDSGQRRKDSFKNVFRDNHIGGHFLLRRNPNFKIEDDEEIQQRIMKTCDEFQKKSFFSRIGIIFAADQPWLAFSRLHTRSTVGFSALVLATQLLSSFAIGALFFSASGVQDAESDPACDLQSFWEQGIRSAAVGIVSSIMAELPRVILLKLRLGSRKYIYIPLDDVCKRERQMKTWKTLDLAAWLWGMCCCAISLLFCAVFIANISTAASTQWFVSSAASLVKKALLDPITGNSFTVIFMCATSRSWGKDHAHAVSEKFFCQTKSNQDVPSSSDAQDVVLYFPEVLADTLWRKEIDNVSQEKAEEKVNEDVVALEVTPQVCSILPQIRATADPHGEVPALPVLLQSRSMVGHSQVMDDSKVSPRFRIFSL